MGDDSGEWIGKVYTYNYPSPDHRMLAKAYYKIGSVGASAPVRLQVWEGIDDTGPVVFDQTYPLNGIFIANTEVEIIANGFVEFEKDFNYYVMMSSDNNFSLRTTFDEVFPWTAGDISFVREDDMLQATPYVDGDIFTEGQWAIQNQKVYECNITGVQTGTFASNSDKWDVLGPAVATGDMTKAEYDTTDNGVVDNSEKLEGNDSAYHRNRTNHTGTQPASSISDFDTEVDNNSSVSANTAKRSYPLADENKLSGIEPGAEVNQSDSEIKTQYEANANTNAFTDAEKSKVASLESSKFLGEYASLVALVTAHPSPAIGSYANVDLGVGQDVVRYVWDNDDSQYILQLGESTILTDAQIKTQYENNPDTNPFTDAEKTNLGNQSGTNTGDVTLNASDPTQESANLSNQVLELKQATPSTDGVMSSEDKTKVDNIIANGAGDGWKTGLDVIEDSPKGTTVLYGAGTYLINGIDKAVSPAGTYDLANGYGSVNHYSGMTNDQHALVTIYVDNAEVIKSIRGDVGEKGDTIFPALQPTDSVCIAYIEIKAGSGGTPKDIDNKHIFDCRTSPSINTDETVSISVDDQSTGFLFDKISSNGNVTATIENPGANETIKLDAPGGGSSVPPSILYTGTSDIDGLDVSTLYPEGILWIDSTSDIAVKSLLNGQDKQRIQVVSLSLKKTRISNNTGAAESIMVEGNADVIADKYGGATLIFNASKGNWYFIGIN